MKKTIAPLLAGILILCSSGCITYPEVVQKPPLETQYARKGNFVVPIDRSTGYPVGTPAKQIERKEFKRKYRRSVW